MLAQSNVRPQSVQPTLAKIKTLKIGHQKDQSSTRKS